MRHLSNALFALAVATLLAAFGFAYVGVFTGSDHAWGACIVTVFLAVILAMSACATAELS